MASRKLKKTKLNYKQFFSEAAPLSKLCYLDNKLAALLLLLNQATTKFSPNTITTISLIFGLSSAVCLLLRPNIVIFVALSILTYTLDNADGMLARATKQTSKFGGFFDWFSDLVKDYTIEAFFLMYAIQSFDSSNYMKGSAVAFALVYISIKAIAHKIGTWEVIQQSLKTKVRLLRYTQAEKYIIMYPLLYLEPRLIIPVFSIHIVGYLIIIAKRIYAEIHG